MTTASSTKAASTPHTPDTDARYREDERLPDAVGRDPQAER